MTELVTFLSLEKMVTDLFQYAHTGAIVFKCPNEKPFVLALSQRRKGARK